MTTKLIDTTFTRVIAYLTYQRPMDDATTLDGLDIVPESHYFAVYYDDSVVVTAREYIADGFVIFCTDNGMPIAWFSRPFLRHGESFHMSKAFM
jgi:hypothetical protein